MSSKLIVKILHLNSLQQDVQPDAVGLLLKIQCLLYSENCIPVTKTIKWMTFRERFCCEICITYKYTVCAKCRDFQWMCNFHKMRSYHMYVTAVICLSVCLFVLLFLTLCVMYVCGDCLQLKVSFKITVDLLMKWLKRRGVCNASCPALPHDVYV
jgi:hypothetical protein